VPLLELLGQSVGIVGEDPSQANLVKLIGNFMLSVIIETLVSGARRIANSAPQRNDSSRLRSPESLCDIERGAVIDRGSDHIETDFT
jgi:hypothetical protein